MRRGRKPSKEAAVIHGVTGVLFLVFGFVGRAPLPFAIASACAYFMTGPIARIIGD